MKLTPRPGGYKVEVYDPAKKSRKRYVGTFKTEREAKAAGRAAEDDVAKGRGRARDTPTVTEYRDRWLRQLQARAADEHDKFKASTAQGRDDATKGFAKLHGDKRMGEVTVDDALDWLLGDGDERPQRRWTHGGLRAMFSAARLAGVVDTNPFAGLGLARGRGRKHLVVLEVDQVHELADKALDTWGEKTGATIRALILTAAFVGMRPAELYGLSWSDIDWTDSEINVGWQYSPKGRKLAKTETHLAFTRPKNGETRRIVLTPQAREALASLPRPVGPKIERGPDRQPADPLVFRGGRGGPITGRTQHYYWDPVRKSFGSPTMDFYELRHFCGSWMLNVLELPQQDVAHQLGHTDGGALVMELYGHPSADLARTRIKRAMGARPATVTQITEPGRSQAQ